VSSPDDAIRSFRRDLVDHLKPVSAAWSVNGRDVTFTSSFDDDMEVGGFFAAVTPEGERVLVQAHALRLATRDSIRLDLDTTDLPEGAGVVRSANVGMMVRYVEGEGQVLGGAVAPFGEAVLDRATAGEVRSLLADNVGSSVGLPVGRLSSAPVDATLRASGFARHTFLCGQSGSGKTYSLGALLERMLLETDLPLVVIDPNSDYVGLGSFRSRAEINRSRETPLSVAAYRALRERYEARADVVVAGASGRDLPLRIHLSDLTLLEQALTLELDPVADADEYAAFVDATAALTSDRYVVAQVAEVLHHRFDEASRRLAQRIQNLRIASWSVWASVDEPSLVDLVQGRRTIVLDTGSLAEARERSVVALALLGRLRRRTARTAMSIVIDEAHNVCSPDAASGIERAVAAHAIWIAGEGRKFGLYMVLSTQRPQKVHRNVISQCDNLLLMRVNSLADLDELATVFSHVPHAMVLEARSFRLGEMLAAGPIAPTPMRLRVGERWSPEGGADLPTTWASRKG
jgi:hypothetical protein